MKEESIITFRQLCEYLNVDFETVQELGEYGLYPVVSLEGESGIEIRNLGRAERVISLYQTLGINKEGIDIILDLREKIAGLQAQVDGLQDEVERLKANLGEEDPELLKELGLLIEIGE